MSNVLEWVIVAFIFVGIVVAIWRGGAANPVSTGALEQKVTALSGKVGRLDHRVGTVEGEIRELKEEAATVKDIQRIEERIETVRAEAAGHRALSEATNRSVERIERVLIERGLGNA